ncbi:hypothetical protein LVJ94_15215 [Pendulispora rubella]|uniref:Uncharacterized protein n=1 Tax=Pendulispora rubella TaxID=2741070 RepID=A0ABZ2LFM0_9BACT
MAHYAAMLGFRFRETMRGTYHLLDTPLDERAMEFTLVARTKGFRRFLREQVAEIEGEVTLEGLATNQPLSGTLSFKLQEKRLPYGFSFKDDKGKVRRVRGQKDFSLIYLADSISTLPLSIYDEADREVGRGLVRFDLRGDTGKLLRSFRLRLAL